MIKKFTIKIEPEAFDDIQQAIDYYNSKKEGLGKRFYENICKHIKFLSKNYFACSVRYDEVRCLPVKKFPYTIHYIILEDQKIVDVIAVFCAYENPEKWEKRIK